MVDDVRMGETILEPQAASLAPERWASALNNVTHLLGGAGATLEIIDRRAGSHTMFASAGVPKIGELAYFDKYAALNPRIAADGARSSGDVGWDYQLISEAEMDRSPFYTDFLGAQDWRYFVSGVLENSETQFVVLSVQRSRAQGHVDAIEIEQMRTLMPHARHAVEVTRRFAVMQSLVNSLAAALDRQVDGVAVLGEDGTVLHLNAALARMVAAGHGLRIRRNQITFDDTVANRTFFRALGTLTKSWETGALSGAFDFPAKRPGGALPYLVALRAVTNDGSNARALLIVKDPATRPAPRFEALRQVCGMTKAETDLASALCKGVSPGAYARERGVSANTVYTHMRRLKQKCGQTRLVALVEALNAFAGPELT